MAFTEKLLERVKHQIVYLHDRCIRKSGGTLGVLSEGNLEFVAYDILRFSEKHKNDPLLVATYAYSIIATRHCFIDGNKRTSHIFAKQFLLDNRIHLILQYSGACSFILKIAEGNESLEDIAHWLRVNTENFNEKDKEKYLKELIYDIEYGEKGKGARNEKEN